MLSSPEAEKRLLQVLAEQLKLPLLQIALQAETGLAQPAETSQTARAALMLIDGYILASESEAQTSLPLEPVSISATLQDIAHRLQPHAQRYDCHVTVHLAGRYGPVMAHQPILESALTMLGQSFIEAQTTGRREVVLAAHRSKHGLVAGIFNRQEAISADMFAAVLIANSLLGLMAAPLQVARHSKLNGLASTFVLSQQLKLVN